MIPRKLHAIFSLLTIISLGGCGNGGIDEVKMWMDEAKAQAPVGVPKIAEPKKFIPFTYEAKSAIDPYSPAKLEVALAKAMAKGGGGGIKPDMERRREPLESYPLDTVKMVGTLNKKGLGFALLQVDKTVFQAKVGNYVGQNFGQITDINETEVELKEIVQDAAGDWVERKAKLELQETVK